MNNHDITVSIIMLCYNHKAYIRQALDSIFSQKTKYNFELLITDDCSQDGSQEILLEYKKKYPNKIRLFLRKKNLGTTKNSYYLRTIAKGKYLAALEGDDFWCSDNKLEKQLDFLESHPEYYACTHKCMVVDENNVPIKEKNDFTVDTFWNFSGKVFTIKDFEKGCFSGHGSTLIAKNYFKDDSLDTTIFYKAHRYIGDRTGQMVVAAKGNTYVLDDVMSCYRYVEKKTASNWQSMARAKNRRFEEFEYICNLEKFANNKMGVPVDLSYVKKDKLICATVVCMREPNKENLNVVRSMIGISDSPISMFALVIRVLIEKTYYSKVLGVDRPIKI